ncbi:MAG: cupin domain-containing protein [Defluviitaleaceae bacterium]|nr:cupin domain-containing protein [Defluviitaleaceae bacterium]
MEKIIISNVKTAECHWDANLNKQFDPDGNHKQSFEFQRSSVSKPSAQGWGKLGVHFHTILPGKTNYPYHYHAANEEVYYIISGEGTLKTPEGDKVVSEGDAIVMPAHENGAHKLTNTSDKPLVYLEVKTENTPDIVMYPDTPEKFLVMSSKVFAKAFDVNAAINYLSGE